MENAGNWECVAGTTNEHFVERWSELAAEECKKAAVQLNEVADRLSMAKAEAKAPTLGNEVELVRRTIKARRLRDRDFPSGLFGEPAWDILLDLQLARLEQRRVTVSDACVAAAVPATTGLRWLKSLGARGLVTRDRDRFDCRRVFVELTGEGASLMEAHFVRLKACG
jgi:hypothetical protein